MMILRHITAAEVRHPQRRHTHTEWVRERETNRQTQTEREREWEGKNPNRQEKKEREKEMFPMVGFGSATPSFKALLVNEWYGKN